MIKYLFLLFFSFESRASELETKSLPLSLLEWHKSQNHSQKQKNKTLIGPEWSRYHTYSGTNIGIWRTQSPQTRKTKKMKQAEKEKS